MKRPLAYLTAAWSGEPDVDMELAAHYCRLTYEAGFSPICPLLYLPLFLNDSVPEEHKAGIDMRRDRLLFFESKDELIYHYGLIHCGEKLFREIDRGDILAWRKQDYEYQILVADREAAARKYKGCVIDPATLDDIMLLYIKGGSL